MSITINASCLCGSVKFTATGQDKNAVACHCSNCKKASGSAFTHNHRLVKSQLDVTQGSDTIREYRDAATKSGNPIMRSFCSNCVGLAHHPRSPRRTMLMISQGSSLYLRNPQAPDMLIVHCGTIDGECAQPKFFVFPEAKYDWIPDTLCKAKM